MEITRGEIASAQKVVIYGPEGIGKSTFVSQFPNPVFIDTEGSTKHMDVFRTPAPSSWTMLMSQIAYFKANPTLFDTVIIDTADWAERLCIRHLCSRDTKDGLEGWGYGKGYTYLAEEFGRLLDAMTELIELNINAVITAHAIMRKFEQPDELGAYDRWEMKLQKKTAPMVREWADMVLFANYKTHVVNVDNQGATKGRNKAQGGKRVMYTIHHPCWDAKNRHNLAPELPLDYKEIAHCIPVKGTGLNKNIKTEPTSEPKRETAPQTETPKVQPSKIEQPKQEQPKEIEPNIPKALTDLMKANDVTVEEIQKAVASRGYYPEDTPITNYDPDFISGVLVGAWSQMFQMITSMEDDIPF